MNYQNLIEKLTESIKEIEEKLNNSSTFDFQAMNNEQFNEKFHDVQVSELNNFPIVTNRKKTI